MRRIYVGLCAGLALMAIGSHFRNSSSVPASNFSVHAQGLPEIEAARARAKASLPQFWAAREAKARGTANFMLKVAIPSQAGSSEHIWVEDVSADRAGRYTGRLANQPQFFKGRAGDAVSFEEAQISDWMFTRFGKIVGNETARPLIARMPSHEAKVYLSKFEKP